MDELKKLVLVRGRVRARCGFGHVRVREVPVAVAYPKSNSHMNSNSCAAIWSARFLVLTGACQFGHGVGGFTTNFIHSFMMPVSRGSATFRVLSARIGVLARREIEPSE